jgi:quercetin dioxygenase-like cupin family protein
MTADVQIQRRDDATTTEEYGCTFRRILPWQRAGASDNGMGVATVAPGGATAPHTHDEFEHFLIMRGEGRACVDEESVGVAEGDVVVVTPGQMHHFENVSPQAPLEVLCLWSRGPFGAT